MNKAQMIILPLKGFNKSEDYQSVGVIKKNDIIFIRYSQCQVIRYSQCQESLIIPNG
jgi:hypothetical protein